MEPTYRGSLIRAFRKTLEDGYFNFVIVDSINDKVEYFSEFWTIAKKGSFEVSESWLKKLFFQGLINIFNFERFMSPN